MQQHLAFSLVLAALAACEDHYVSNPPAAPESYPTMSSTSRVAALFVTASADAAPPASSAPAAPSLAMTITLCSSSPTPCDPSAGDASVDASYRVTFGSGRAVVRSRDQAKADLYRELRDHVEGGERLDAEPRILGSGKAPDAYGSPASTNSSVDPMLKCALQLLDIVDSAGEVSLNVVRGSRGRGCQVSLGGVAADGGAGQCLVHAPEREKGRPGGRRGR